MHKISHLYVFKDIKGQMEFLPLLEFGCLRFSVPQTETLACSLGRPARSTATHSNQK